MPRLARPAAWIAALALSAGAAFAQQPAPGAAPTFTPSHVAVARDVASASGITRSLEAIVPQLYDRIREQIVARPELTKDMEEVLKVLQPEMELQKQRMVSIIAGIYARQMSEAELNEVMTFFRSPTGRKYVETQPVILDDLVREMHRWTQEVAEYVMVRVRAELSKRGHQLQ
jgi:uncharacterized protein